MMNQAIAPPITATGTGLRHNVDPRGPCHLILAFAVAALLAAVPARADGLFRPAEMDRAPQPWFGSTVDGVYEPARERVLQPAAEAATRVLRDPVVQGWIEQTQGVARDVAEGILGKAITVTTKAEETAARSRRAIRSSR